MGQPAQGQPAQLSKPMSQNGKEERRRKRRLRRSMCEALGSTPRTTPTKIMLQGVSSMIANMDLRREHQIASVEGSTEMLVL